jgi:alanine racemase
MPSRARADVDLSAIGRNVHRLLTHCAAGVKLCAVVKADGYGHGAIPVARAAVAAGATWLAVATASEAAERRQEGIRVAILVLGPLDDTDLDLALCCDADVIAWAPGFVKRVAGRSVGRPARLHVKLDSGMGRLGARTVAAASDLCDTVLRDSRLRLVGAMTHFATADEPADGYFGRQLDAFTQFVLPLRASHPEILVHAANSAATLSEPNAHFDMVRCGVSLYGLDPFQAGPETWGLEPALELRSYVARLATIDPGETVGYGRQYVAREPTDIATVPMGYADGLRRSWAPTLEVLVGGRRCRLAGMISMDSMAVELAPANDVAIGAEVVIIGRQGSESIQVGELARAQGTINYEIVCGLGRRVRRHYLTV